MASVPHLAMSQIPDSAPCFVSVVHEFPEDLYEAMRTFVRSHPHWDQYRLLQVALAGFLFQQGSRERAVARHYLDGLFDRGASGEGGRAMLQRPPSSPQPAAAIEEPTSSQHPPLRHPPAAPAPAGHRLAAPMQRRPSLAAANNAIEGLQHNTSA